MNESEADLTTVPEPVSRLEPARIHLARDSKPGCPERLVVTTV